MHNVKNHIVLYDLDFFWWYLIHFISVSEFQKFKVTTWAKDDYGSFYNGDSYIILNVSNYNELT